MTGLEWLRLAGDMFVAGLAGFGAGCAAALTSRVRYLQGEVGRLRRQQHEDDCIQLAILRRLHALPYSPDLIEGEEKLWARLDTFFREG